MGSTAFECFCNNQGSAQCLNQNIPSLLPLERLMTQALQSQAGHQESLIKAQITTLTSLTQFMNNSQEQMTQIINLVEKLALKNPLDEPNGLEKGTLKFQVPPPPIPTHRTMEEKRKGHTSWHNDRIWSTETPTSLLWGTRSPVPISPAQDLSKKEGC